MLYQLLFLATEGAEGLSGEHIASKLAFPLGVLIFCGSVYLLLWSNYGAKKGALIYGTAFGGFSVMLGVFWWFGAPGTPVATGLQNFPGQASDAYQAKWHTFELGSETATFFPKASNLEANFTDVATYLGKEGLSQDDLESDPKYGFVKGELDQAGQLLVAFALNPDENGNPRIGGTTRAAWQEQGEAGLAAMVSDVDAYARADVFVTAAIDGTPHVTHGNGGVRLAGAEVTYFTNYVRDADAPESAGPATVAVPVGSQPVFTFQEPSLIWFPSAVWTGAFLLVFLGSLFGLDRIEQREKREQAEVQEPETLAVPIRQ